MEKNRRGITLIALIITIIVLVILAGVAINTLYGENGIISDAQDVVILSNIKSLEEAIDLYKVSKNIEGKIDEESYPIALNEDGSRITLNQMKNASELAKLPDEVKYTLLNLTTEKGTTNIPSLDKIDYSKFYKLDYTKLNISQEETENLVIYIEGDIYKVINLAGVKYKKNDIYVIIPLDNESEPEYITVANNTYKLYGDGTLKVLGEKTTNSGYTSGEVNIINYSWDEFDLKAINARFDNRISLPDILTSDWYASHVYFSTGTAYVIDENNDLWGWGANDYNKLGLGHSFLVVEPTKILDGRCEGKENVKASKVWAGINNTFIVDTEGNLWACGSNGSGILGQENSNIYNKWINIDYIDGRNIKEIQIKYSAIIIMNNGEAYAAGSYFSKKFELINKLQNVKKVLTGENSVFFISSNDVLYGIGWKSVFGATKDITINEALEISKDVKNISNNYFNDIIWITNNKELYSKKSGKQVAKVENIEINDSSILVENMNIITNGELWKINTGTNRGYKYSFNNSISPYLNNYQEYEFVQTKQMDIVKNQYEKVCISSQPNITKIGEKSNYNLKKIFKNAIYVHGKGVNISIVDKNNNVYESATGTANSDISNARKIISSPSSKYVIKRDGTLWAKGMYSTGMWGEKIEKNEYVQVTKDGKEIFKNIRDIYASAKGHHAIFITDENRVYWAGRSSYGLLPNQKGDFLQEGAGYGTNYPEEVQSNVLNEIKEKIKDIQYTLTNTGGIWGRNTIILTEDGKIYTMSDNKNMSGNQNTKNENGDFTELTIREGTTVKQVETGDGLSLALLSNGEVYGWSYNTYGILGQSYEVGGIYPTPVKLEGLPANIRYMSLGNGFAIFASKSGEVYGIGKNDYGQLGTGDSMGRTEFVRCTKLEE